MNSLYRAINTTKQNVHQRLERYLLQQEEKSSLRDIILDARNDHPQMGAESLYRLLRPSYIGRDRFRDWYNEMGFTLHQPKNYRCTTDSSGVIRFDNLLTEFELTGSNQVFVSDITYYEINDQWYYLTFIMDLYSRVIKGYIASRRLSTNQTTIPALMMATKDLEKSQATGLILHSDGGGQYYSKRFLKLTENLGLKNSMCESVYENSHAERINGTIKNSYLKHYNPQNFRQLRQMLTKAVHMYNTQKPHQALGGMTPEAFEKGERSYQQKRSFSTKKKVAKKKINYNNNLKTVNLIQ